MTLLTVLHSNASAQVVIPPEPVEPPPIAAPPTASPSDPSIVGIKLNSISATGEACPKGSWSAVVASNGQKITLSFTRFAPTITPSSKVTAKECRLAIVLKTPINTTYQVRRFVYRGYAYLEKGVEADVSSSIYFQLDQSKSEQLMTTMRSPFDGDYIFEDRTRNSSLWSPCARTDLNTLNVQTNVQLRNGNPPADGTFEFNEEALEIELEWQRCTQS